MSDAELHVLRARLRGGILNQARRGALKTPLPVGLVYDAADNVVLDPDSQVRTSIAHLFETFARTGPATATVKHFREQELRFPRRPRGGPHKGELLWEELRHWRVLRVLHNPRYAGAFCFGRTHAPAPGRAHRDRGTPARGVDCAVSRRALGLHHLGAVRGQPRAAARQCPGPWRRAPQEPTP